MAVCSDMLFLSAMLNLLKTKRNLLYMRNQCVPHCKLTYLLHGVESFLRSQLVLQLVKKFLAFLEPEGSSPYP